MIIFNLEEFKKKIVQHKNESDYEKTIQLCCDMIQYGEKNNHHRALVEGYFHRGVSYYNIGDVKNAFKDLMHHKELIENEGTNQDFLNSYNFLFALHLYNEDYVKCKDVLIQLINLTKRIDNKFMLSNGYSNYSHVLNLEGSHEEALNYAEKAYDLAMRYTPDDEALIIRALFNITKTLIYLEDSEKSKAYLNQIESMEILKNNQRIIRTGRKNYRLK
jgi:tetratricopeptide (TPR) repeat protein